MEGMRDAFTLSRVTGASASSTTLAAVSYDTWQLQPAGSLLQNPAHTYATPGNYTVALSVNGNLSITTKPGYIRITPALFGDASEDGEVNQADTLVVLQEMWGSVRSLPPAPTGSKRLTSTQTA